MPSTTLRRQIMAGVRSVVVKAGTNLLTRDHGKLDQKVISSLTDQLAAMTQRGIKVTLVSSGAVGSGMGKAGMAKRPRSLPALQAAAAIGQPLLMSMYEQEFARHELLVGQILVTRKDFEQRSRYVHISNTIGALHKLKAVPIINENDTVAVDELDRFADNDTISALITNLIEADLLIILSDIEGLCEADPRYHPQARCIHLVEDIDMGLGEIAGGTEGQWSVGGMVTKIEAAKKASRFGIPTMIACGTKEGILHQILGGKEVGTLILPKRRILSSRKGWIAFHLKPKGEVVVDDGAKKALCQRGKSLLASGVMKVNGIFDRGDAVSCIGPKGKEFARGLVNYNASELEKIKGLPSSQIEKALGFKYSDEVIHRNNLVVL